MKEKLRYWFHELYYKLVPPSGIEFAMTCRQATEIIDLGTRPSTVRDHFRLWLHLRLCQACNYYYKASQALSRAVREMLKRKEELVNVRQLNQELLKKHGQEKAK
jgi:hypothetical protein